MNRPNTRSVADQTGDQTPFSIPEAADRLGMTSEAIRMRLKRGTLAGEKIDGRWVVYLPATEQHLNGNQTTDQTATEQPPKQPTEHDQTNVVELYESMLARQDRDIEFLRDQLDHSRRELAEERERFDIIHREALQRIEALTEGIGEEDEPPRMPLDDPPAAPGREIADEGLDSREHRPSWLSVAWSRVWGRS